MKIQTMPLGVYSANTYIVVDEKSKEAAVIDCGECTDALVENLSGVKLKYILLTHGHADHIIGVYALKQRFPDALIVIHALDAPCLTDSALSLCDEVAPGYQNFIEPDLTVTEGDFVFLGETKIKVMHTPGHTVGGVCYYIESEHTIFTGDTLFCLTVGRTDFFGGSDEALYSSVKRLYEMSGDYNIYPGHNRATTMEYERRRNRYMRKFKGEHNVTSNC